MSSYHFYFNDIIGLVLKEVKKTQIHEAIHGKKFDKFWKVMEALLPSICAMTFLLS